jgi:hypothetical protein
MEKGRFSNTQLIIIDYKVFLKLKILKIMLFFFDHNFILMFWRLITYVDDNQIIWIGY